MAGPYQFGVPGASDTFEIQSLGVNVPAPASVGTIATGPPVSSASVSMTAGNALQNTLGYDAILMVTVKVTAATTATISAGVGPSSSPTANPFIATDSLTGPITLPLYVPNGYYAVFSTAGTITETATGMWFPV